jgi:hypothetical protein
MQWCVASFNRFVSGQEGGRDWYLIAMEREYPNLAAALAGFLDSRRDLLDGFAELCHALLPFWARTGRHEEGCRWLEVALRQAQADAAEAGVGATSPPAGLPRGGRRRLDLGSQVEPDRLQADLASERADWEAAATSFLHMFEMCERRGDPLAAKTQLYNAADVRDAQ